MLFFIPIIFLWINMDKPSIFFFFVIFLQVLAIPSNKVVTNRCPLIRWHGSRNTACSCCTACPPRGPWTVGRQEHLQGGRDRMKSIFEVWKRNHEHFSKMHSHLIGKMRLFGWSFLSFFPTATDWGRRNLTMAMLVIHM